MSISPQYAPELRTGTSIAVPATGNAPWLVATVLFCLLLYYFIGVDQGSVSIFGNDTHIHEFVHDARHFLAFPCH